MQCHYNSNGDPINGLTSAVFFPLLMYFLLNQEAEVKVGMLNECRVQKYPVPFSLQLTNMIFYLLLLARHGIEGGDIIILERI